jgi:hypothetical protein
VGIKGNEDEGLEKIDFLGNRLVGMGFGKWQFSP